MRVICGRHVNDSDRYHLIVIIISFIYPDYAARKLRFSFFVLNKEFFKTKIRMTARNLLADCLVLLL